MPAPVRRDGVDRPVPSLVMPSPRPLLPGEPEDPTPGVEAAVPYAVVEPAPMRPYAGLEGVYGDFERIGPHIASNIRRRQLRNKVIVAPLVVLLIVSIIVTIGMFIG